MIPVKNNNDRIRKTMQMHEYIFKHQVRELYRLYSVQRMLMDELRREIRKSKKLFTTSNNSSDFNFFHKTKENNTFVAHGSTNFNLMKSSRQYQGSSETICSYPETRSTTSSKVFSLERSVVKTSATKKITSPMGKGDKIHLHREGCDEDTSMELTLTVGGGNGAGICNEKRPLLGKDQVEHSDSVHSTSTVRVPREMISRKRPHWLFQGLRFE